MAENSQIVSHHPLTIDAELAAQLHYAYDEDPSLIWYRSQHGVVEADGLFCSLACGFVAVVVCIVFPVPICFATGLVVCTLLCNPDCVGEGC